MESPETRGSAPVQSSPAIRASELMAQAHAAAFENTRVVDSALRRVIDTAREIAEGGDAYPPSVRDLCGRLADETEQRRQLLECLAVRGLDPGRGPRFGG